MIEYHYKLCDYNHYRLSINYTDKEIVILSSDEAILNECCHRKQFIGAMIVNIYFTQIIEKNNIKSIAIVHNE
jgi:hypothetical protein